MKVICTFTRSGQYASSFFPIISKLTYLQLLSHSGETAVRIESMNRRHHYGSPRSSGVRYNISRPKAIDTQIQDFSLELSGTYSEQRNIPKLALAMKMINVGTTRQKLGLKSAVGIFQRTKNTWLRSCRLEIYYYTLHVCTPVQPAGEEDND